VHADRVASLTVGAGDDDQALLYCHAGCETEAVVHELDLEMRDLFEPNSDGPAPRKKEEFSGVR
jgi:hypothetical protein